MTTAIEVFDPTTAANQHDLDRLHEIEEQERRVQKAEDQWKGLQQQTKAAKEAFDYTVDKLRQLIRERDGAPLFNGNANETSINHESWRDTEVDDLGEHGLTIPVVAALKEADLNTLGDIADYTASGKLLTDIKGIGNAKAEAIENCMTRWFAANPTQRPPSREEETDENTDAN